MAGLFALMLLMIFKEEGWVPSHHEKPVEVAPAPKPAAAKPAATVAAGPSEKSQEGK
jgi:hypothetical protein